MLDFIKDNAIIFIIVGSFIILVAIGFIVDTFILHKKKKKSVEEAVPIQENVMLKNNSEQMIQENVVSEVNSVNSPEQIAEVNNENRQEENGVIPDVTKNETVAENTISSDDIEEVNESPFSNPDEQKNDSSPWEV